jgi:hypothetical protein
MTSRSALIALLILLLVPAAGYAADPLLSGYAGPGGGEQVVLGGGTVGGGGGTSGGNGAAAATGDESLRAPAPTNAVAPGAPSKLTDSPQKRKTPSSAASQPKTMPSATTTETTAETTPVGAPQPIAYPTRAGAVSGLPISAGGVLALIAFIALFVLAALGLRRLSVGSEDAPAHPQVSSS